MIEKCKYCIADIRDSSINKGMKDFRLPVETSYISLSRLLYILKKV